jgi:hypothetical protein
VVKGFYLLLIKLYQNGKSIALKSIRLGEIVYWIVEKFERREMKGHNDDEGRTKITLDNIVDTISPSPKQ